MFKLWICLIVIWQVEAQQSQLDQFTNYKIVDDIISYQPTNVATVIYPGDIEVEFGNIININNTVQAPQVNWDACCNKYYTLILVDPDAPTPADPSYRSYLHWVKVNIPYDNVASGGDTLVVYARPNPPRGGIGYHRYTLLILVQPSMLAFDGFERLTTTYYLGRQFFDVRNFTTTYGLGEQPYAGNFFLAHADR